MSGGRSKRSQLRRPLLVLAVLGGFVIGGAVTLGGPVVAMSGAAAQSDESDTTTTVSATSIDANDAVDETNTTIVDSGTTVATTTTDRTKERVDRHKQLLVGMGVTVAACLVAFAWHTSPRRHLRAERRAARPNQPRASRRDRTPIPNRVDGGSGGPRTPTVARTPSESTLPPSLRVTGDRRAAPRPTGGPDRRSTTRDGRSTPPNPDPRPAGPGSRPASPEPRKESGGRPARRAPGSSPGPPAADRTRGGSERPRPNRPPQVAPTAGPPRVAPTTGPSSPAVPPSTEGVPRPLRVPRNMPAPRRPGPGDGSAISPPETRRSPPSPPRRPAAGPGDRSES